MAKVIFFLVLLGTAGFADTKRSVELNHKKNLAMQAIYLGLSLGYLTKSAESFRRYSECKKSCPLGCCSKSDQALNDSHSFLVLSVDRFSRVKFYESAAVKLCDTELNEKVQRQCLRDIVSIDSIFPKQSWYENNGRCKSTAPRVCQYMSSFPLNDFLGDFVSNKDPEFNYFERFIIEWKKNEVGRTTESGVKWLSAVTLTEQFKKISQAEMEREYQKKVDYLISQHGNLGWKPNPKLLLKEFLVLDFNGEKIHSSQINLFSVISDRYKNLETSLISPH